MKNFSAYLYSFLCLNLLISCTQKDSTHTEVKSLAIPVKVNRVSGEVVNDIISISGNVEGNTTVHLGFLVGGKLNYISSKEGQHISNGQLVASLDPENYMIAKDLSDVQLANISDEFGRLTILHDRNSLSESDFVKTKFSLQQAQLQQRLQQKNLNDTKLFSPISGILIKKNAEIGEIIGVGTPLFVISDVSTVKVLAYIPEGEMHNIKIGKSVSVTIAALDKIYTGKIVEVGSSADELSRAFTVKIEVNNPDLLIRPGMIAESSIPTTSSSSKILLPIECIGHDLNNQNYVYLLNRSSSQAFKRKIIVGQIMDNRIEVKGGLSADDEVIVEGQTKLSDGALVSIK